MDTKERICGTCKYCIRCYIEGIISTIDTCICADYKRVMGKDEGEGMSEIKIVYCSHCGYYGKKKEFVVNSMWEEHVISGEVRWIKQLECPKCYSQEEYCITIDTEQQVINELNKLYRNIISLCKELENAKDIDYSLRYP